MKVRCLLPARCGLPGRLLPPSAQQPANDDEEHYGGDRDEYGEEVRHLSGNRPCRYRVDQLALLRASRRTTSTPVLIASTAAIAASAHATYRRSIGCKD